MRQQSLYKYKRLYFIIVTLVIGLSGALTFAVGSAGAAATTYYVSPSGNDSNNGTSTATPWKTITHVNTIHFNAGDSILFLGGSTFSGQLYFGPAESGSAASPITLSSYGTGDATISAGSGNAIYAYDSAGFSISKLNLTGAGAGSNSGSGINFYNDDSGNTTLNYLYVNNVTARGFQNGFSLGADNGGSGYSNVTVTNSTFDNNQLAGLQTYGPTFDASSPVYVNQTVNIGYVTAYDNYGNAALTGSSDSGNGIVLGSTKNSNIYDSTSYDNGGSCKANACGVGIWAYDSTLDTIEYNESYSNQTGGPADGDGFDLDQNTSNSLMQYNYSLNNAGSGYLLFGASTNEAHTGNTVRFNISQNDGRKNSYGGIETYGNVASDAIYNNTIYTSPSSGAKPTAIYIEGLGTGQTTVRNNILYASGGVYPVLVPISATPTTLEFQQNDYYGFIAYWGTTTYTTLASLQNATGEEMLNGTAIGYTVNPDLNKAGGGSSTSIAYDPSVLTQYKLASGSPMKNAGINLTTVFGMNIGSTDYYGTSLSSSSGLSVGAAE